MTKLGRFFALPPAERRLLLQSAVLLPLMALGLKLFGFQHWFTRLNRSANPKSPISNLQSPLRMAGRTTAMVRLAERYLPLFRATCLHRSLTLWWLLRRQGIAGDLRIGVRRQDGRFEAHAWVEYQSTVLNDTPDVSQRFAAFDQPIVPADLKFR